MWPGAGLPAALYLALFVFYTGPRIGQLFTHLWSGGGDGLLSLWNLWWADYALTHLHQSPWFTTSLHAPHGITLVTHSLCLAGTTPGIPLVQLFGLIPAYNLLVLGSFVGSGLTMFWLARRVTRSYVGALVAGFIFTFSNYHFAHAEGHLDLITLQWLPLFLLCCVSLVLRPSVWWGLGAGISLAAVFYSDYYYALYAMLAAVTLFGAEVLHRRGAFVELARRHWPAFAVCALTALAAMGPVTLAYWRTVRAEAIEGHGARAWSLDTLGLVIPGGHWRFAGLTRGYWEHLPGNPHEKSVHLGLAVFALAAVALASRRRSGAAVGRWLALGGIAAVLALGPRLQVGGQIVADVPMPYSVAVAAFPLLGSGGTPVRLAIMVTLAFAVAAAWGAQHLLASRRGRWALAALTALLLIEYWPQPIPAIRIETPHYVEQLRNESNDRAVLDLTPDSDLLQMYYQTIHRHPIAGGFISRIPASVKAKTADLMRAARQGDAAALAAQGIGYVVIPAGMTTPFAGLVPWHQDDAATVFRLNSSRPATP